MTRQPLEALEDRCVPVPIPEWARRTALQFARSETSRDRARRVCCNTLAACTVKDYLQSLGYAADLTQSECWQPLSRHLLDVADVGIQGKGVLECRPIAPGETTCPIPPEVADDRLGYVLVQIDLDDTREATILGFARSAGETLSVFDLESLDALPEYLADARLQYRLGQWFEDAIEAGWAAVEDLIAPQWVANLSPIAAARSAGTEPPATRRRVRAIDFGAGRMVALVLTLRQEGERTLGVTLEACPCQDNPMPEELRLVLLDETGASVMETQASGAGAGLHFSVEPGEEFSLELRSENATITEHFSV